MKFPHFFLLVVATGIFSGCGNSSQTKTPSDATHYDLSHLLHQLNDVSDFARPPVGTAHMISTYDQSGGNNDFKIWTETEPDGLITLARIEGPGYLTRFWNTGIAAQDWHFFFDDESTARLSNASSNIYRNGQAPFIKPITDVVSGGSITYLPMPFEKSLRIAASTTSLAATRRRYWHINYVKLPAGSKVTSFPAALSPAENQALGEAAQKWINKDDQMIETIVACGEEQSFELAPEAIIDLLKQDSPGQLSAFTITLDKNRLAPLQRSAALRELVLRVYYNGQLTPSIEAPLGDFFCNAFHSRQFSNLPLANIDHTFVCRFPMPFAQGIRMELANEGKQTQKVGAAFNIDAAPGAGLRYLHASWNGETSRGGVTRQFPFRMLRAKGRGHYVGAYVNAISTDNSWFILEGDEQIRIDGDFTPRFHGTGLEDYFNGGWYYTGLYDYPLAGLVEKAPIRTDQYRLHLPDRIAFETEFNMSLEFGDANRSAGYMSAVAYWYQDQPAELNARVPPLESRTVPADAKEPQAIMANLFELEREGLFDEARERCDYFSAKFNRPDISDFLELRSIAYSELIDGYDAVKPLYDSFNASSTYGPARSQGTWLNNLQQLQDFIVLGVHAAGNYKCYLDGKVVSQGTGKPNDVISRFYTLPAGEHTLSVEIEPAGAEPFYSMFLKHKHTNIVTDATWESSLARPADWPLTTDPNIGWQSVPRLSNGDMLPRQNLWSFKINAFVDVQSARQLLRPWKDFPADKKRAKAYLRRTLVIPAE